jgi:hypothetical protein
MSATSFVYAIGDIHGCLHKLQTLMARCERHAGNAPAAFVSLAITSIVGLTAQASFAR